MQTFIVSSNNLKASKNYVLDLLSKEKITKLDISIVEIEKTMGIEDVRFIQKGINLKPFQGDKKAVVIIIPDGATVDAQNSMLKILEEPPSSTLIYIITPNFQIFLPTILSRVKIIDIKDSEVTENNIGYEKITAFSGIGDKLYLAQNLGKDKDKQKLITWLEGTIISTRKKMLSNIGNSEDCLKLKQNIKHLNEALGDIRNTNTNPRLTLENLFLSI